MILVTGAKGFVGSALVRKLQSEQAGCVVSAVRVAESTRRDSSRIVEVGDLSGTTDWSAALDRVERVVHLAARVHVMRERDRDPESAYQGVNVDATLNLARQAARQGVRRFVFLSSIKVNGETTDGRSPFTAKDAPRPQDPYGVSKLRAEIGLQEIGAMTGMEVTIIRPPLVYGPGVAGNFRRILSWIYKGIPLPFGAVRNARSLVALDNLVDLVGVCLDHPAAGGHTFLVADGQDLSTGELCRRVGAALGRPARLVPVPHSVLATGCSLLGCGEVAQRLLGSLRIDAAETRERLAWRPTVGVSEGISRAAEDFLRGIQGGRVG